MQKELSKAAEIISNSKHLIAFCGAGISVESGIPPFRGEGGLWNKYDPACLDLDRYLSNPCKSWHLIKEIFYDFFGKAKPNAAHYALAHLEDAGILKALITQNIDNLHQDAGSKDVVEFHGNSHHFVCTRCHRKTALTDLKLTSQPPKCPHCGGLLKPDFIFFGEMIPEQARDRAFNEAEDTDVVLVIGTTGEIMPASMIPYVSKQQGAEIIEINPGYSSYQNRITDIHLIGEAGKIMPELIREISGE